MLYHVLLGNIKSRRRILITGGMHAREWITTLLIYNLIHKYKRLNLKNVCFVFVPCCNPNGLYLATHFKKYKLYKNNGNNVDINKNFDCKWELGGKFKGKFPQSEWETRDILAIIEKYKPTASLAFHSKGEIIYYKKYTSLANILSKYCGYKIVESKTSFGGLSDFLNQHDIPSFTIEVGSDKLHHPITPRHLPSIIRQVRLLPLVLSYLI
ncbi:MAG: hypothetical protein LBH47_01960 [Christensenellaceae bacterium]|nr:hypothetical protein [Christensenellaceae bacterium]